MLTILATAAALLTGSTCAAIDNGPNRAAWAGPTATPISARYDDMGDRLVYRPAPGPAQNDAWLALHTAEAALQTGPAGRKVRLACVPHTARR